MIERRRKAAKFLATKSVDSFGFVAIPSLKKLQIKKLQILELVRGEWIDRC